MCLFHYLFANGSCTILSRTVRNQSDLFSFGSWRMVLTWGPIEPSPGCVPVTPPFALREQRLPSLGSSGSPTNFLAPDWSREMTVFPQTRINDLRGIDFWDYSSKIHLLQHFFFYYYYQVHLRSMASIRSWRLGTLLSTLLQHTVESQCLFSIRGSWIILDTLEN